MEKASEKLLASCNLNDAEQRKRGKQMKEEVFHKAKHVVELEDGYDFVFYEPIEFANDLLTMVNFERVCCPYFTWAMIFKPQNEATHLQIYGSPSIKEELRMGLIKMEILK